MAHSCPHALQRMPGSSSDDADEAPAPLYRVVSVCRDADADELSAAEHPESGTVTVVHANPRPDGVVAICWRSSAG
jgi:hypothetical protein